MGVRGSDIQKTDTKISAKERESTYFCRPQCLYRIVKMSRSESTDKFCLKWNDFDTNLRHAFQQFREEKDFFDVSLVCEDEQIEAHKMILSASSVFFKNLFKRNSSHKHPFIYLKGVKLQELQSLLQFMYQGEVNVDQDDLQTFLAAAEELRVHGLTQDLNKSTPKANKKESKSKIAKESLTSNSDDVLVPSSSLTIPITNMYDDANDDIAEVNDNEVMAVEDPLSQHGSSNNQYYPEFDDSHSSSIDFSDEGFLFNNLLKGNFTFDVDISKTINFFFETSKPGFLLTF